MIDEARISQREKDAVLKMAYGGCTGMKKEVSSRKQMTGETRVLVLTEIEGYWPFSRADTLHVRRILKRKRNDRKRMGVAKIYAGKFIDWEMVFTPRVTYVGRDIRGDNVRFTESQKEYYYFNKLLKGAGL